MIISKMDKLNIIITFYILWQKKAYHEKVKKGKNSYESDLHSNYGCNSGYLSNIFKDAFLPFKYFAY